MSTSGTANDLNYITGNDAGMMQLELSAANINRVGRLLLSVTDAANHVPVFHEFFVLPQAIYDWLTGVIVPLPANVTTWLGTAAATPTVAAILVDTAEIGAAGAGLTEAGGTGDHLTAINLPNQTMDIVGNITGNLSGSVGSLTVNNDKTGYVLSATGSAALTESYAADGAAPTLGQAIYEIKQFLTEKNISSTTLTVKKLDGTTTAATYTLDSATTPASITRAT